MEILFIVGIAQALFFAILLLTKNGNIIANRLLAVWLFLICFALFINYLYITGLIRLVPHLAGLDSPLPFLNPPFIFLYSRLLTKRIPGLNKKDLFHLLPFLIYSIYLSLNFYSKSGAYKYDFMKSLQNGPIPFEIQLVNYIKIFQAAIYLLVVLIMIKKHQTDIKQEFSFTEKINLTWLKIIVYSLIVVYFFKFLGMLASSISFEIDHANLRSTTDILIIIFIYVIAFYGLKQPVIFSERTKTHSTHPENDRITKHTITYNESIKKKYANSPLSVDDSKKLLLKLKYYMETEKPYLKNQLSINDIAEKLEINTKYLSQVINEQVGLNFFNYVNQYRIEEVKKRLLDKKYEHLSIFGIAFDCGFNSKSSFNSIFKKYTNQTPTGYISEIS